MRSPILPMSIKLSHPSLEQPNPAVMPSAASTSTMLVGGGQDDLSTTVLFPSSFEDEKTISIKPLLPRSLSYTGSTATVPTTTTSSTNSFYQQRRRRIGSENSLSSLSSGDGRHHSFSRDVGHAVAETFLLTRLSLKLLRYLGYNFLITSILVVIFVIAWKLFCFVMAMIGLGYSFMICLIIHVVAFNLVGHCLLDVWLFPFNIEVHFLLYGSFHGIEDQIIVGLICLWSNLWFKIMLLRQLFGITLPLKLQERMTGNDPSIGFLNRQCILILLI